MKILLITRFFPPEVTGGARRPSALVKSLREMGHEVYIAAPAGAECDNLIPIPHPSFPVNFNNNSKKNYVQFGNFLRKQLLIPDPEIRWALRLVRIVKEQKFIPDIVISTSPPESLHIAGRLLKNHFKCKWVAEFRDPWIQPPQRKELELNSIRRFIETCLARFIFSNLDGIVAVSETVLNDAISLAPNAKCHSIIGHFALPFIGEAQELPKDTFNIVHTGAVTLSNPLSEFIPFLRDFEEFCKIRPEARLYWAGRKSSEELEAINKSTAKEKILLLGNIDLQMARALQMGADALLLLSGDKSHALPGKYSEYVLTGRPIITYGTGDWRKLIDKDAYTIELEEAKILPKNEVKKAAHFDAKQAVYEYSNLFEKILSD